MKRERANLFAPLSLGKAAFREQAVRHLDGLVAAGVPRETALQETGEAFTFSASTSSLRRWERRYRLMGFRGLFENKIGRVGRKAGSLKKLS